MCREFGKVFGNTFSKLIVSFVSIYKKSSIFGVRGESHHSSEPELSSTKEKKDSDNPYDSLKWIVVKNDGRPQSLMKLVALKSLFSKQLPKMPRAYIARLVFDQRHTAIAILNDDPAVKDTDEEVIGSICYRAFPEMRFAEIAFCAVNASHQVKVNTIYVLYRIQTFMLLAHSLSSVLFILLYFT